MIARLLANIRDGRVQKLLAATTALSAPALGGVALGDVGCI